MPPPVSHADGGCLRYLSTSPPPASEWRIPSLLIHLSNGHARSALAPLLRACLPEPLGRITSLDTEAGDWAGPDPIWHARTDRVSLWSSPDSVQFPPTRPLHVSEWGERLLHAPRDGVLVIHSLDLLLLQNSLTELLSFLARAGGDRGYRVVVGIVTGHFRAAAQTALCRHFALSWSVSRLIAGRQFQVLSRWRGEPGQCPFTPGIEVVDVGGDGELVLVPLTGRSASAPNSVPPPQSEAPSSEIDKLSSTFKLSLKDEERAARSRMVMPFWTPEQHPRPSPASRPDSPSVRIAPREPPPADTHIFYEPEDADDWDEEDPDEDLDF